MSSSEFYTIGVDVGTGSVRVMFFDDRWSPVVNFQKPINIFHETSSPLEYEQSSADIWSSICFCVRKCLDLGSFDEEKRKKIRSIGFDATCSLVVLDSSFEPVSVSVNGDDQRNIIMWLDHRANLQADLINRSSNELLKNFGGKISLEMQPGKILWLKTNLPSTQWERMEHFFDLPDFLHFRATEQFDRSLCSCVCKLCYRSMENRQFWDENFWQEIGLGELMQNNCSRLGQSVRKPFSKCETDRLCQKAADELSLPVGIRVGPPLIDAYAGALGGLACRCPLDNVRLTERLVIVAGTSSCFMGCSENAIFVPGVWGPHYNVLIPNLWLSEGGQSAAGKSIDHVIETHPAYKELKKMSEDESKSIFEILDRILDELKTKSKVENVSFLSRDFHSTIDFHGNRSPLSDPNLGGAMIGLNFDTSINNLALQYLSIVQAIGYDSRQIIEAMMDGGHRFRVVQICAGLSKLRLLTQIIADVVQMPVYVSQPNNDCVLLGAAISGHLIAENAEQVELLLNQISAPTQLFLPDEKLKDFHGEKYQIFRSLQQIEIQSRKRMNKFSH